ncbi:MAG: alpha/beta fold hydrolase [Ideonella sp.]|nr:alpha/beta fold hydrolase [Ideonella sp.]MCC7459550.1 alpha/beta fold hydrolase [Nitrospira sp.]
MPTLRLPDIDLHYECTGEGPPLLLIHGLGSSTRDWEHQVPHFARRYRVICADMRGHGRSHKPPGPYSIARFAADTAVLLQALKTGPAHVVGISMGGMIAFQLAVDAPELVRSLAIVNSGPELVPRGWKMRLQIMQRRLILRWIGMRKLGVVLSERLLPGPELAVQRKTFVERWAENDPRAYRDAFDALIGWSVADRIGEIRCPTLVVAADQDYTPVAAKQAYVQKMPDAELVVIPDARHAVTAERPEAFNTMLTRFLERVEAAA